MKYVSWTLIAGFVALAVSWPAQAEIINLKCHYSTLPADSPNGLVYWIDLERSTITRGNFRNHQVEKYIQTDPIQITPEAFKFSTSMGAVTIDRVTGVNTWYGPPTQIWQCSKDTLPFPRTKF